jgi:hypothetical protein
MLKKSTKQDLKKFFCTSPWCGADQKIEKTKIFALPHRVRSVKKENCEIVRFPLELNKETQSILSISTAPPYGGGAKLSFVPKQKDKRKGWLEGSRILCVLKI